MKLCSRLFVLHCRNCPKDDKFRYFIPTFRKVRGGVELWLMARWKARVEFLLSVIGLIFLFLTVEALQGKMCQNSLPSGGGRSLGVRFQGRGSSLCQYIDTTRKAIDCATTLPLTFLAYIMELCSRLFVLYCPNCPKDDKFKYFIPILRKLRAV